MKIEVVDCLAELFAYTYYLVEKLNTTQIDFDQVRGNYTKLIDQARECGQSAGITKKKMDDAFFPVFAWIDESLLETSWKYKREWTKNSLQKLYFNTTNAGEIFFTRLDKLGDSETEVYEVYLYCLASGFRGDMYQPFHQEQLKSQKQNILKKIIGKDKLKIPEILFPKAGNKTLSGIIKRKRWKGMAGFSYLFVLLPVLAFVLLFYFFDRKLGEMIISSGIFMS